MQLTLSEESARTIQEFVDSGEYATPEAVVDAALRVLRDDTVYEMKYPQETWEEIRESLVLAKKDIDEGRARPFTPELVEEITREGRRRLGAER